MLSFLSLYYGRCIHSTLYQKSSKSQLHCQEKCSCQMPLMSVDLFILDYHSILQIDEEFDLHLYITTKPELNFDSFFLLNDPSVSTRVIPSLNRKLCIPSRTAFHLLSFRSKYSSSAGYLSYSKSDVSSVSICNYTTAQPSLSKTDDLRFILPNQLRYVNSNCINFNSLL